jgi:hypothetical protein
MQSLPWDSRREKKLNTIEFRKKIASELLGDNKENIDKQSRKKRPLEMEHRL